MKNWLNSIYTRLALVLTIAVVMGVTIVQPVHAAEIVKDGSVGKDEVINDDVFSPAMKTLWWMARSTVCYLLLGELSSSTVRLTGMCWPLVQSSHYLKLEK